MCPGTCKAITIMKNYPERKKTCFGTHSKPYAHTTILEPDKNMRENKTDKPGLGWIPRDREVFHLKEPTGH